MDKPPVIPAEKETRIVLSVLAGEITIAEAARRERVSERRNTAQLVAARSGRGPAPASRRSTSWHPRAVTTTDAGG